MKNFVKLVEQVYEEYYPSVCQKIRDEKIPVAFLATEVTDKIIETIKDLLAHKINVKNLIVINPPPGKP